MEKFSIPAKMVLVINKRTITFLILSASYLLILGQGCSALKTGVEHVVSVPIPQLNFLNKSQINKKVYAIETTKAPVQISVSSPEPKVTSPDKKVATEKLKPSTPILELKPIKKVINIQAVKTLSEIKNKEIEPKKAKDNKSLTLNVEKKETIFSLNKGHEVYGFVINSKIEADLLRKTFTTKLEETFKKLEAPLENERVLADSGQKNFTIEEDNFKNDEELSIQDIIKTKSSGTEKITPDDLVMIDYSKKDFSSDQNIANVSKAPLSNAVTMAIARELDETPSKPSSDNTLLAYAEKLNPGAFKAQGLLAETDRRETSSEKQNQLVNRITIQPFNGELGLEMVGNVANFSYTPAYDPNESFEDYGDGKLDFEYSLASQTGLLRGTLSKQGYMRTTLEVPIGSEYSYFEVPFITQESLESYLDKNQLNGFGGYYLVELGDGIEDVEIEKYSNTKRTIYEHRVLLDDNLKKVKDGAAYKYALFVGVEPGNINVRYLGVNGQETSKISFLNSDEITFDFSQIERPREEKLSINERNTLGKKVTPLNISPEKVINFLDGSNPTVLKQGQLLVKTPWMIKGSRNYLEFAHMEDSIFVGHDSSPQVEVPSREFVGEVLRSFRMDFLRNECIVQINFKSQVKDVKIYSESFRGPSSYEHAVLDQDGVFGTEISPITEKYFLLGVEEGIFNIYVEYEDRTQERLRTYCSPSSYLVEQL